MKILGINGSPRKGGNTEILLEKVLEGARQKGAITEHIVLNDLKISPCQECEDIGKRILCKIKDDMQEIYKKIKEADVIVLASPIFFGSLSAQTKIMIDRFQCVWRKKYVLNKDTGFKKKRGIFICVEASRNKKFFDNARSIVRNLFATINLKYEEEIFCSGLDKKGEVLKHQYCLKKAFQLGERLARS